MTETIIKPQKKDEKMHLVIEGVNRDYSDITMKEVETADIKDMIKISVEMGGEGAQGGTVQLYITKTIKIKKLLSMIIKALKIDEDPEHAVLLKKGLKPTMVKRMLSKNFVNKGNKYEFEFSKPMLPNSTSVDVLKDNDHVYLIMA
jgi:hypothetical protein